jgi:hypothetical protein
LAYWSMSELLRSLDLLNKGYNQLDDPCKRWEWGRIFTFDIRFREL